MPRHLVTGGCGFIGSHLSEALLGSGAEVVVFDDLSTGRRERLPQGAELVVGDIRDATAVRRALDGCDGCFHLAAVASVQRCEDEWAASHDINLGGTLRILEAARDLGNLPVVYASSAAAYGDLGARALDEATAPAPISAYGADKYGCELQARAGGRAFGLPTAGLRFFNVFGPGQDPHSPYSGAVSVFAERLRPGGEPVLVGDGEQIRDDVYVGDVIRALILALGAADVMAPVFNVCRGRGVSVLELARQLFALRGRKPAMSFAPPRLGDIRHSLGSPSLAAAKLGFRAEVPLVEGLEATLQHLERQEPALA